MKQNFLFALACLVLCSPAFAEEAPNFWLKTWTVSAIHEPDNSTENESLKKLIGKEIVFSQNSLTDPTYQSCPANVIYEDIRLRDSKTARQYFGDGFSYPALPEQVYYGMVRCKDPTGYRKPNSIGGFIFVNDHLAYRVYEDNVLLELH